MIQLDKRLFSKGVDFSERLEKKLKPKGAYETIFVKGKKITEAAHSNVWIIKNDKIITHPANREILKGVTRTVDGMVGRHQPRHSEKYSRASHDYAHSLMGRLPMEATDLGRLRPRGKSKKKLLQGHSIGSSRPVAEGSAQAKVHF